MSNTPAIPQRFSVIDENNRDQYAFLQPEDQCIYIWERMSQLWSGHEQPDYKNIPATNQFISNFQIPPSCKTTKPKRHYFKEQAIAHAARALGHLVPKKWREEGTFVPTPPSKVKTDNDYDPRLHLTLQTVKPPLNDIRELILQHENVTAKRKGISPAERATNYSINEAATNPTPAAIFLFDDVLTTGCHYKAIELVIKRRFPNTLLFGLFLARAVRPPEDEPL